MIGQEILQAVLDRLNEEDGKALLHTYADELSASYDDMKASPKYADTVRAAQAEPHGTVVTSLMVTHRIKELRLDDPGLRINVVFTCDIAISTPAEENQHDA